MNADLNLSLLKEVSLLYVEDDASVRGSLLRFLQRRFDRVYAAGDGREGLELFRQQDPDLVVTDIQMPLMDGLAMSKQIREERPDVPILITTAFNEIPFLMKSIELGISRYIKKPIVKDDFIQALFESARVILQKREIEQKNRIIRTIMDWQPCFTVLTDGENLDYVNQNLLNFLGYETMDQFVENHRHLDSLFEIKNGQEPGAEERDLWYQRILESPDIDHVVYLRRRDRENAEPYVVRYHHFQHTNTYIFAFLDPRKVVEFDSTSAIHLHSPLC